MTEDTHTHIQQKCDRNSLFVVVQLLNCVQLSVTPQTAALQAFLQLTWESNFPRFSGLMMASNQGEIIRNREVFKHTPIA